MSTFWGKRATGRRTAGGGDTGSGNPVSGDGLGHDNHTGGGTPGARPKASSRRERPLKAEPDAPTVTDLRNEGGWAARVEPDAVRAAEMAARFRARAARLEAQRELQRLRDRHWSGQRLIEEGRTEIQWWEHPEADPYAVLGLIPGARIEDASAARRKIAQTCHPDRLAEEADPDLALRRMVAANAAYDRLRRALHPV